MEVNKEHECVVWQKSFFNFSCKVLKSLQFADPEELSWLVKGEFQLCLSTSHSSSHLVLSHVHM